MIPTLSSSPFKPFNKNDCILMEHRVDVWQFSLKALINEAELCPEEQERAARFYFPKHRQRFIYAHTLLRRILARYLKIGANQLNFSTNAHGKPHLSNYPSLQFNLSHSKDTALLAVGKNHSLGVDLEYFSARPFEGIGGHIFSTLENHRLQASSFCLKPLSFFHLWAQKEAIIKACGLGLSYPTKQLDLPLLPTVMQTIFDELHQTHWQIFSFMPDIACCAALCCHPSITEVRTLSLKNSEMP